MMCSIKVTTASKSCNLLFTLRWWTKLCSVLGLPFGISSCSYLVKLYTLLVLMAHLASGFTVVTGLTIRDIGDNSTALQISGHLGHASYFLINCGLHAVIVWKLHTFNEVIDAMNQQSTVEIHFQRYADGATQLTLVVVTLARVICVLFQALESVPMLDLPEWGQNTVWAIWEWFILYQDLIVYTIVFLIMALGYQFSLLQRAIETETLVNWEKLYERHIQLCKLAGELQKLLNVPLMLIVGCTLINLCIDGFYVAESFVSERFSYDSCRIIISISLYCIRIICVCAAGDYLRDKANSMALDLAEADFNYRSVPNIRNMIRGYIINVRNLEHLTSFSVSGFCQLSKSLFLTMLAAAITYFVLLRQVRSSEMIQKH